MNFVERQLIMLCFNADWWDQLTIEEQKQYLKEHPGSKLRFRAKSAKPTVKKPHSELVKKEVAIINPKLHMLLDHYFSTNKLEKIAQKHLKIKRIPLNKLFTKDGQLPGQSAQEDNSSYFNKQTSGMSLKTYQNNDYAPVLAIKDKDGIFIINGRHRTINLYKQLKRNKFSPNNASIRGRIFDMTDEKIRRMIKRFAEA